MSKPATTLLKHNLTGILETAVRSSNAQYDDPEILNRLDVRLLEVRLNILPFSSLVYLPIFFFLMPFFCIDSK